MTRVLLFGGSGQLGAKIRAWNDVEISAPTHAEADLTDVRALDKVLQSAEPNVVINCTAYNDVPRAQVESGPAFELNALAVGHLAKACARARCRFVTISTDYVFDGALGRPYVESDRVGPINTYGFSKLAGELLARQVWDDSVVVRTCGLYGTRVSASKGHSFINTVLTKGRAGEALRIVDDQVVSPTYAGDLSAALRSALELGVPSGIYHGVNEGACTWFEFAREILLQAGIECPIEPVTTADSQAAVRRPSFSALKNARLHELGIVLPTWQEGISAYLRDLDISP